jgi:microcystin-dependent protein
MTAGELAGWVFISSSPARRFYVSAKFALSGAGGDYNLSYQTTGDTPPVGFLVDITTTGMIRVTLPASSGSTSVINYALNAPAIGASFPLTVSASQIVGDTNPVGTMLDYAGTTAPTGYLMCDGSSLPVSSYAALFAVVAYAYGGSGASFNIPDFRGRFARYNDNMGTALGAAGRDTAARAADKSQTQGTAKNGLALSNATVASSGHYHSVPVAVSFGGSQTSWETPPNGYDGTISGSGTAGANPMGANMTRATTTNSRITTYSNTSTLNAGNVTTVGLGNGDTDTRPINLSCNKIIKF